MINNINSFNQAKMIGAIDKEFQKKYNFLIDLLQTQIKVLQVTAENGISVDDAGSVSMGLASSSSSGALTATDWGTFDAKLSQDAISDAEFDGSWEDDTLHAASKNALYDVLMGISMALSYIYDAIGSMEYTEQNYITDDDDITSNLDALDMALADVAALSGGSTIWGAL